MVGADKVLKVFQEVREHPIKLWSYRGDNLATIGRSMKDASQGNLIFFPLFAYMASKQQPGEKLAELGASTFGIGTSILTTPLVTAGLHLIPGFSMLPPMARTTIGMFAQGVFINSRVEHSVGRFIKGASKYVQRQRELEMGGGYRDSEAAAMQRIAAVQEMSSAFGSRRRYFGQEARLLHG